MNRNVLIGGVVVVAALVVLMIILLGGDGSGSTTGDSGDPATSSKDPTVDDVGGNLKIVRDDPREALSRYMRWAQYPPTTRPLHAGQADLLDPFNAARPALDVIAKPAECTGTGKERRCSKKAVPSDVKCKLTPESSVSFGTQDFHITLYCYKSEGAKQTRVAISGVKSKTYRKLFRKLRPSLPPVAFGDGGTNGDKTANDLIYTFSVRPQKKDWGVMFLEVDFQVGGHRHVHRASWYSTPQKVAKFRGGLSDQLQGGHLVVKVPVTIYKPGYYKFDANLQEAGGDKRMVASASFAGRLAAGSQSINLRFWGKVIRDKNVDGPYIVRNLRGIRDNSPVTPDMLKNALESGKPIGDKKHTEPLYEYVLPFKGEFKTNTYRARDFSDKVYDSPEKQRRVKYLKSLQK